jgi:hypothetical protein
MFLHGRQSEEIVVLSGVFSFGLEDFLWRSCGYEITASFSLAKTANDDSFLGLAFECLPSLLVLCFSEQFW